jgi:porin
MAPQGEDVSDMNAGTRRRWTVLCGLTWLILVGVATAAALEDTRPASGDPAGDATPARPSDQRHDRPHDIDEEDEDDGAGRSSAVLVPDWLVQARDRIAARGIVFEALATSDVSGHVASGGRTSSAARYLLDLGITLDGERLLGLRGTSFGMLLVQQGGESGSRETGDAQIFSNIDADGRTQIAEAWWEQRLLGDRVRTKVGKVDANGEFAYPEHGLDFIGSSMGFSPTILGLPTYPDPAFSVNAFASPDPRIGFGAGVYDGSGLDGVRTGSRGPSTVFDGRHFVIGQVDGHWGATPPGARPGTLSLGGWAHTDAPRIDDERSRATTGGLYLVLDQVLWRPAGAESAHGGIGSFLQYGHADGRFSDFVDHVGGGLTWHGPEWLAEDVIGLGLSWVRLTGEDAADFEGRTELVVETFYRFEVGPWLVVKPDVQYIHQPSGRDEDVLVGTLRLTVWL